MPSAPWRIAASKDAREFSGKDADAYGVECVSEVRREMSGADPSVTAERVERGSGASGQLRVGRRTYPQHSGRGLGGRCGVCGEVEVMRRPASVARW